jgi:hypothetical protein
LTSRRRDWPTKIKIKIFDARQRRQQAQQDVIGGSRERDSKWSAASQGWLDGDARRATKPAAKQKTKTKFERKKASAAAAAGSQRW